jgi:hypothetical protein
MERKIILYFLNVIFSSTEKNRILNINNWNTIGILSSCDVFPGPSTQKYC